MLTFYNFNCYLCFKIISLHFTIFFNKNVCLFKIIHDNHNVTYDLIQNILNNVDLFCLFVMQENLRKTQNFIDRHIFLEKVIFMSINTESSNC